MVCTLPCVARVRRCGQQEWTVHSRDRGTDIACLIPDSLRLCVCVCVCVCMCVCACVCVRAFMKDRVWLGRLTLTSLSLLLLSVRATFTGQERECCVEGGEREGGREGTVCE